MTFRHAFALSLLLAFLTFAQTQPATSPASAVKVVSVAGHGDLQLDIPQDWIELDDAERSGGPQTLHFKDPADRFELFISILPPPDEPGAARDFNTPAQLRRIAQLQGERMLPNAIETTVQIEEIAGEHARGYVYTFSDKSPAPASFEFMTGGVVGVGDLILSITMLMHEQAPPQRATAVEILRTAKQSTPAPATGPAAAPIVLSLPSKNWQLALEGAGLRVLEDETSPDKRARRLVAIDPQQNINVSIFLEPAATIGDAKTVRAFYFDRLRRSPLMMKDDKFTDFGAAARADYVTPDVDQRHINLYFSRESVWIDVHLSIHDPAGAKLPMLEEIARTVRLEAKPK